MVEKDLDSKLNIFSPFFYEEMCKVVNIYPIVVIFGCYIHHIWKVGLQTYPYLPYMEGRL